MRLNYSAKAIFRTMIFLRSPQRSLRRSTGY
jgi:hypothetical protein